MKNKLKLIVLLIIALTAIQTANSQTEVKLRDIECYNLGDGRYFCQEKETKKPLQGSSRIIDGYTTQYTEAVFKDGIPNGSWKNYKYNKLAEEFTYSDGVLNGAYKEYYSDGTVKASRNYVKGKPEGKFIQYGSNGKIESEVNFKNGVQDGAEIRYDSDGKVRAQSNFSEGKNTGKEVRNISSNAGDYVMTSNYNKDGKYDGEYSEIFTDGKIKVKGLYKNGKKEGTWEYGRKDGKKVRTDVYSNDDKIKETTYYTDNTVEVVRELKNGKKNGWERKYNYGDGALKSEVFYKDGVVSSDTKSGAASGSSASPTSTSGMVKQTKQISSNTGGYTRTFYEVNGKYEGEYSEQWTEGAKGLKAKGQYKNGKKIGLWVYGHKNGQKDKEENYVDGELEGNRTTYSENGKVYEIYKYTKGEKNGPYKLYSYNTDVLRETGTYVSGRVKGIRKYYDQNGKLSREEDVK